MFRKIWNEQNLLGICLKFVKKFRKIKKCYPCIENCLEIQMYSENFK